MLPTGQARWIALVACVAGAGSCQGLIGGAGGDGSGEPAPPSLTPSCEAWQPGPAPLRRLTRAEYNGTVALLLGDHSEPANAMMPDERHGPFYTNLGAVSDVLVAQYASAASQLAERAVMDLSALVSCDPAATGELACLLQFIESFGKRAYRRPLAADELAGYQALAGAQLAQEGFVSAVRLVLETMLQSPHFLYHVPDTLPAPPDAVRARLTPYAIASRLSFLILQRAPDDALLEAAERGELDDAAGIEAQARQMLASANGRAAMVRFHSELLGLDNLPGLLQDASSPPELDAALIASMREETETFVAEVLADGGDLVALLTAAYTYADARAAALYEVLVEGEEPQLITLDPLKRSGLLTQPSILALHHSPVRRGLLINELLLCVEIPPPPPSAETTLPEPTPGLSPREQWLAHVEDPACASCHERLDPLGFAFDHYDQLGRWQEKKGGFPVDATGQIVVLPDEPSFDGAVELISILTESEVVEKCIIGHWVAFALSRALNEADSCLVEQAQARFESSGLDLTELFVAIVTSPDFAEVPRGDSL